MIHYMVVISMLFVSVYVSRDYLVVKLFRYQCIHTSELS